MVRCSWQCECCTGWAAAALSREFFQNHLEMKGVPGPEPSNASHLHVAAFVLEWAAVALFLWKQGWPNVWERLTTSLNATPTLNFVVTCPPSAEGCSVAEMA